MPSAVTCGDCGAQFEVTQDLWESEIDGKLVRVRCKRCGAKIRLDGRNPTEAPKHSKPPPANVREKLTSIVDSEPADVREETPTVPLTEPGQVKPAVPASHQEAITQAAADDPWMVSYADDDDREKTTDQVKAAFKDGEIHTDTLIWRDGMDDWLLLREVPIFSELFPKAPPTDQTGGFLGTGAGFGGSSAGPEAGGQPTLPLASTEEDEEAPVSLEPESLSPESLPPESIDPDSMDPDSLDLSKPGSMIALSAGTLKEGKPRPPPPRHRPPAPKAMGKPATKAEEPRIKRLPKPPPAPPKTKADFLVSDPDNEAPAAEAAPREPTVEKPTVEKPQGKSKPKPPANLKRPETIAFDKDDLPPDSAPDVGALSRKFAEKPKLDAEALRKKREDEELLRMGSVSLGDTSMGVDENAPAAPTIDISNLDASAADSAPPSSKKKKKRKAKSGPPSSRRVPVALDEPKASEARSTPSEAPVTRSKPAPAESVEAAPVPSASGEGGSKVPLYVALGLVAAFAIYWFGLRPAAEPEASATKPVATDLKATESPGANAAGTPPEPASKPTEPAEPAASAVAEKPEEPSSPHEKPAKLAANPAETAKAPTASDIPSERHPTPEATAKPKEPAEKPTEEPEEPKAPEEPAAPAAEFNVAAARTALASAAAAASSCRREGDPTGTAQVTITFAPSGRATSANISGPPFAGTATGGCIAATMRRAQVPPFSGGHKTVGKTVVIR